MKRTSLLLTGLLLAGCAGEGPGLFGGNTAPDTPTNTPAETPNPDGGGNDSSTTDTNRTNDTNTTTTTRVEPPVVVAPPPPDTARTPEQFDTTTPEQREEAVAPPPPTNNTAGDGRLGTTVASIGAADEPGFWIKTPLVSSQASGRLFYPASGRTVQVQLIPSGGGTGSGSQVSLAALRLLDAPLDGLPELVVYQN